jgi:hypothetical protein
VILDVLIGVCFFSATVCVLSLPWMLGAAAPADTDTGTHASTPITAALTSHHPSGKTVPTATQVPEN